jgi:ABC-type uncharacterized transport system permease subunit
MSITRDVSDEGGLQAGSAISQSKIRFGFGFIPSLVTVTSGQVNGPFSFSLLAVRTHDPWMIMDWGPIIPSISIHIHILIPNNGATPLGKCQMTQPRVWWKSRG